MITTEDDFDAEIYEGFEIHFNKWRNVKWSNRNITLIKKWVQKPFAKRKLYLQFFIRISQSFPALLSNCNPKFLNKTIRR